MLYARRSRKVIFTPVFTCLCDDETHGHAHPTRPLCASYLSPSNVFQRDRAADFFFPRLLCFSFHFFGGDGGAAAGPAQRSNSMLISFTRGPRDL